MPCTSGSRKKRSMTRKPCAPTPMKAMLTLSLGGTYPVPPNTWRGTMDRPIAAAAVCARNLRRETERSETPRNRIRFFTVPPNCSSQITRHFGHCTHFAKIYHSVELPDYCKRPEVCLLKELVPKRTRASALQRDGLRRPPLQNQR